MLQTHTQNDTLQVAGLDRLTASNSTHFKEFVKVQLGGPLRFVEVDCANVQFMDSSGLGALLSVQKVVAARGGRVRLVHVQPAVRQLLELLKFQELFEINA